MIAVVVALLATLLTPASSAIPATAIGAPDLGDLPVSGNLSTRVSTPLIGGRATIGTAMIGGRASWVRPSLGSRYLAMRYPHDTLVRLCGQRCVVRTVNDYGPSSKIRPRRIADMSAADFQVVCGPLSMGTCEISAEFLESIQLPATDTAP